MKKIIFILYISVLAVVFIAAKMPARRTAKTTLKKSVGCGYRIIEFGKGVDCNGDTVKLVRTKGFQQLASRESRSLAKQ